MKNLKQKEGITLIALIITIIVLLILAGVTINMLTGDNGILKNAQLAADKTELAQIQEKLELLKMELVLGSSSSTSGSLEEILGTTEFNQYKDKLYILDGQVVYKPDGCTQEDIETLESLGIKSIEEYNTISTVEELKAFRDAVNAGNTYKGETIYLLNDLTLDQNESWVPIGIYIGTWDIEDAENSRVFNGSFDGANNTISNIYISQEDSVGTGLFGYIGKEATIKNLKLGDGNIIGFRDVGGIAGRSYGNIINCINKNTNVTGTKNDVGGIVGRNYIGTISNTKNYAKVQSLSVHCGGIAGTCGDSASQTNGGKIISCENFGIVICDGNNVGGIVGYIYNGDVNNSSNYGQVTGWKSVGGLVGTVSSKDKIQQNTIVESSNFGNIYALMDTSDTNDSQIMTNVGGIVGYANYIKINACINKGNISSKGGWIAGIIGSMNYGEITKCGNEGIVSGTGGNEAGILGSCLSNESSISYCYNSGSVSGKYSSGIVPHVGWKENGGTVQFCYNTGKLISTNNASGINNRLDRGTIQNCYNTGILEGKTNISTIRFENTTYEKIAKNLYALENETYTLYMNQSTNANITNIENKTETDMKSAEFITLLNAGQKEPVFVQDTTGINDGYPILKWQLEQ